MTQMPVTREQRKEPRRRASGPIQICFQNPEPVEFEGSLIDLSPTGFRAIHECGSLPSGAAVEFRHSASSGEARVMWNRYEGDHIESGFLLIP